ncbi:MAG: cysteine desulfurase [Candidatus Woesearchaeota archaeon]
MDINKIRQDFPLLQNKINGKPIIYFDNACMSLKPIQVIDKINYYYKELSSCGERAHHKLGKMVDDEVEKSRNNIRRLINAKDEKEIVFTKNTTESINLVSNSFGLKQGDVVIISDKEHNSNLLPWLELKRKQKIILKIVGTKTDNTLDMEDFKTKVKGAKLVSMVHTSNIDGVTNNAKEIIKIAHEEKAKVLLDGAQSVPHTNVNVKNLDVDFLAFSGHKMLGPTATGVLYAKKDVLEKLEPFVVGGGTVDDSNYESAKFQSGPQKFEAGLQNYAGIIGLGEAANYLMRIGYDTIKKQELLINKKITSELTNYVEIIGPPFAEERSGIFSFISKDIDHHEIAIMLDNSANIIIRSGAHCVHSWFNKNKSLGTARASFYFYNTIEEADIFVRQVKKMLEMLK